MGKRRKFLLAGLVAVAFLLTMVVGSWADDYSSHWSSQFINDAYNRGWMTGDGNGNFRPESAITRGEFAVMLWRAKGQPVPVYNCVFKDVPTNAFYYKAVAALNEAKVVNGLDAATFGPNNTLTREMGCTMLARAYNLTAVNTNAYQGFVDSGEVSDWARAEVAALVEKGYLSGVGDNRIAPKQPLKRGEMAKLLITVANAYTVQSEIAHQNAMSAVIQYASGPSISIKQTVLGSDRVRVAVTITDDWNITFAGWRESEEKATYKSKSGFDNELSSGTTEIIISENGWYAVYAENKNGFGNYKLFEVKTINKDAPVVKLSQETNSSTGKVTVFIKVTEKGESTDISGDMDYIGYRPDVNEGDTFSNENRFTELEKGTAEFTVNQEKDYGWYAVCAINKKGEFGYSLIEIKKPSGRATAPAITTTSLPDGVINTAYSQTLAATGSATIEWTLVTGSSDLADDLKVSATGVLSCTPKALGEFKITVKATNDEGSDSKEFTIKIVLPTYRVTYNANGGSDAPGAVEASNPIELSKTRPTREGYEFLGWAKSSSATNAEYQPGEDITVEGNITLYAVWKLIAEGDDDDDDDDDIGIIDENEYV
ncbi:MAG: S-layer homology domain-containing protein [Clostridiales bacterium]|nr:S-layer homology domain-containing protein [Clostridiales bacterium]